MASKGCGSCEGVNVTAAAIAGVAVLLASGVTGWDDCLGNNSAWNTFTWFAAVIAFATQLKNLGFVSLHPYCVLCVWQRR